MRTEAGQERTVDYRLLMKKVEEVVEGMERESDPEGSLDRVIDAIIRGFRDELGIVGGRLYRRRDDLYELESTFGDAKRPLAAVQVPASYPPIRLVLENRTLLMPSDDTRLDREFEGSIGAASFAAIEVGDGRYIIAFDIVEGYPPAGVLYSLGILHHSLKSRLKEERWAEILRQAHRIQESILPRRAPAYGRFDIHGRTALLETVGGDFYDFLRITDKILGTAIADVSGHGLPAALQVRDIHMGLRMGMSRDLKIVRTVERMNSIIHHSTLTSRFVSMFYGELELSGQFIYVNAGHPPPFHLAADGTVTRLEEGGAVLGPLADAAYERGFVRVEPGDVLVMYTDGITETHDRSGRSGVEFGLDRLVAVVADHRNESASEIVDAIFAALSGFCGECPAEDDRTVVVIKG